MMKSYLDVLQESLEDKWKVLEEIEFFNNKQELALKAEQVSMDEIDLAADEKEVLINKLIKLDQGFESLFEKIKEELIMNRDMHKVQIQKLQKLISEVTDKSIQIQAQEVRNKKMIEQYFENQKQNLKKERKSSVTAYKYYKSMSNADTVPPQFVDSKK